MVNCPPITFWSAVNATSKVSPAFTARSAGCKEEGAEGAVVSGCEVVADGVAGEVADLDADEVVGAADGGDLRFREIVVERRGHVEGVRSCR